MKTCKHCGVPNLQWRNIEGRWRLYRGDSPHICGPQRRQRAVEAWSQGAYEWKPKPVEACPPEAEFNYSHAWWDWLDTVVDPRAKGNVLKELVP